MTDKDEWVQRKEFEDKSIDLKPWDGLNTEFQNSLRHEAVKFAFAAAIEEVGHEWDSEVEFPNGREADIVDLGPKDGKAVVYEVETGLTSTRKREKLDHFYYGFEDLVRDVIVVDPAEVPVGAEAAVEYLLENEVIGGGR